MTTVLVTGGSGFIASHCIVELLKKNYKVRVTLRNKSRIEYVQGMMKAGGVTDLSNLSFHIADLNSDEGWKDALDSVSYVMHIASPFPSGPVRDKEEVITTASQGTLRVLKFAESARVKRVVLTSSFGAIGYGHPRNKLSYSENDWSNTKNTALSPYIKSKTVAEKRAWQYIRTSGSALELSVINPVGVFGPTLGTRLSSSLTLIQMMLKGKIRATPKVHIGIVDVRDLAALHVKLMTSEYAANKRFIASANTGFPLIEIANTLKDELGTRASKVPRYQIPNWLLTTLSIFIDMLKEPASESGKVKNIDNTKAKNILGWEPRPVKETIRDSAESLYKFKLV